MGYHQMRCNRCNKCASKCSAKYRYHDSNSGSFGTYHKIVSAFWVGRGKMYNNLSQYHQKLT